MGGYRSRLWPDRSSVEVFLVPEHFDFPPVVHDWVIKGLGMSSHVCVTGYIKDPVPLTEKRRASCLGGRFPRSFTWLNKLRLCPEDGWLTGVNPPLKPKLMGSVNKSFVCFYVSSS